MRIRKTLELIYFNVALFCVLLVGMEVGGQLLFYLWKGYPVFRPPTPTEERVVEQHPFLVGRPRAAVRVEKKGEVVTTTPWHTRWTGAPANPNAIRVVVVGGSTTFGAGVTDTASWPAQLQAMLGSDYDVINFGMLGYSTAEGVIQMGLLVPEVEPDVVVFYEGWNDLQSYHDARPSPDYYTHGMRQYTTLTLEPPHNPPLMQRLADMSAIVRLALVAAKRAPDAAAAPNVAKTPAFATPDTFVDRIYRRNLETLKVLAERTGAYTLFVPQVLNEAWYREHDGSDWWTTTIENHAMPALLHRFNQILKETCGAGDAQCAVVGDVDAVHWQPDDFIDEGHFSGKGGTEFAGVLAPRIRAYASSLRKRKRRTVHFEDVNEHPGGVN